MGNVLHTQRLVRAARLSNVDGSDHYNINSALQLVEHRPALLRAKSAALEGTLWHHAAATGNVLLLEGLIRIVTRTTSASSGAATQQELCQLLNQTYRLDTTPLMLACQHGHTEAACILLQHGADPLLTDRRGSNTCLHIAACAGHAGTIRVVLDTPAATYPLLLETGVASVPGIQQQDQPQQPAVQQQLPAVQQQQQQAGASLLDNRNMYGLTALHVAVCMGRGEAADVLLQAGASLLSSSKYPVQVGRLYLPHRTTPLHAAVQARDTQRVTALLTVHEQRYGGTAEGRGSDPRWLRNGDEQLPYQLARGMQLPDTLCELLYPMTPLREGLQQWQQGQQQQQRLCRSLQELAAAALKEALISQLHCMAAAVGAGSRSGPRQQQKQQQHQRPQPATDSSEALNTLDAGSRRGEQQQQLPEAIGPSSESLSEGAAELFLKLQESGMVCVSVTHSERLCMKMAAQQESQLVIPSTPHEKQLTLPRVLQLSQQSLLDVVRFYILCHGVCDPSDPDSCWFADACSVCTAAAVASSGTALGKQPASSLMPSSSTQCGDASRSSCRQPCSSLRPSSTQCGCGETSTSSSIQAGCRTPVAVSQTGCDGRPCSSSSTAERDDHSNGSTSTDCYSWSLRDLQCSFMTSSQCSQFPGACLLDHSRLVSLLQSMQSSCAARWSVLQGGGSWREACGVCFEEEQGLLLQLQPCRHVLCLACVELLVGLVSSKPALCPFCRAAIAGVHVHVGQQGLGADAEHSVVTDIVVDDV